MIRTMGCVAWAVAAGAMGSADAARGAWLGIATLALAPLALQALALASRADRGTRLRAAEVEALVCALPERGRHPDTRGGLPRRVSRNQPVGGALALVASSGA